MSIMLKVTYENAGGWVASIDPRIEYQEYLRLSPDEMSNQFRPSPAHDSADIQHSNCSTFGTFNSRHTLLTVEVCYN